ncbi:MAG: helix-turn-helix domain-containing protein [Bryobacteraceae bacterium]
MSFLADGILDGARTQKPAESDLERYFQVSPPAIHEMVKTLERNGLVERTPGQARSIRLLVQPEHVPRLE